MKTVQEFTQSLGENVYGTNIQIVCFKPFDCM